jgi:hypothetical protein
MLQFFKKVVQECITTNNLRPEYEMWLYQDVYKHTSIYEEKEEICNYLNTLHPDKNGWIFWFLYSMYFHIGDYVRSIRYLTAAKECNHKYAICVGKDVIELQELAKNGYVRAYYFLQSICRGDPATSQNYFYLGIENSDFLCVWEYVEGTSFTLVVKRDHDVFQIAKTLMKKWGYHRNEINFEDWENKDIAEHLHNLNIPCSHYFKSEICNFLDEIFIILDKGRNLGCTKCKYQIGVLQECIEAEHYIGILKEKSVLEEQVKQLQTLKSQTLEEVVKNIISEYI